MATKLYDKIIFGPIKSRRLGISLGVNLLPLNNKLCSFECIYCECGFTKPNITGCIEDKYNVVKLLQEKLKEMKDGNEKLDVITFAGNGEPTLHPDFPYVVEESLKLRDKFYPEAKISVLSNATMLHKESVIEALKKVDNNILKLDSAINSTVMLIDEPHNKNFNIKDVIENLKKFDGNFIMQTMFLRGEYKNNIINNTTDEEISAWIEALREIKPKQVMIYAIDRDTPVETLEKIKKEELNLIADKARKEGFVISVAG